MHRLIAALLLVGPIFAFSKSLITISPHRFAFCSGGNPAPASSCWSSFGFDRIQGISAQFSRQIAVAARQFGDEDGIAGLTIHHNGLPEAAHV
jgi:hypothetical protein